MNFPLLSILLLAPLAAPAGQDTPAESNTAPASSGLLSPETAPETANMSDNDRNSGAKEAIAEISNILSKVIRHLQSARDEKDAVKLNCVNEKLTKIKGLLKISEQASITMQEAMARKDSGSASSEYSKIIIAKQKCAQLAADSEACVGELAVYSGEDELEVTNENESPYKEEQITADSTPATVLERPPEASPYQ